MNPKTCPVCHATIPANAPGGFCPACLLLGAEEPAPGGCEAPPLAEIAAAFPQLEIVRLIGQGGMGCVYEARQPALDRTVALKILSPTLSCDPAFAERFAREARVLGKLNHPNIVTVFEHGESGGFFYLLMEYVEGVNLRQAMSAGKFTPEQALAIVPPLCDALQAAHAEGIWHRDIKPENILLDTRGGVKIADFGIARLVGDHPQNFTLTMTGGALGSAAYMAPEQHENPRSVDHRADIYSLGVVIYEMLTGELPLGRFPAPSSRAAVNARIDEIVFRTLEKEREQRQQSAAEVKTDVQGAARSGPVTQSREQRPRNFFYWAMAAGLILFPAASVFTFGTIQGVLLAIAATIFVLGGLGVLSRLGRAGWIVPIVVLALIALMFPGAVALRIWNMNNRLAQTEKARAQRMAEQHDQRNRVQNEASLRDKFSTPEKLVQFHLEAAQRNDLATFESDFPARWIDEIVRRNLDMKQGMQEWSKLTYSHPIFEKGDRAALRLVGRETGNDYNLPVVRLSEGNWRIDALFPIDVTGYTQEEGLQRMNSAIVDDTAVRKSVESMIDAAQRKDVEAFRRGFSSELLDWTREEDMAKPMRLWSGLSYDFQELQDGDHAMIWVKGARSRQLSPPKWLIRQGGEWKLRDPDGTALSVDSPWTAMEEFLKASKEKDKAAMKARSSRSLISIADADGPLDEAFRLLPSGRIYQAERLSALDAEVTIEWLERGGQKAKFHMVREDGLWKLTERVVPSR